MIPKYIILHCSATADSETLSWDDIKRYHIDDNGWSDIGYHYGIERHAGDLIVLQGRKPHVTGAHCKDESMNYKSLGVCVVGEFDSSPPSDDLYRETIKLLAWLCFTFQIPSFHVKGHREYTNMKTCPGMMWDLVKVRGAVEELLWFTPSVGTYLNMSDI